MQNSRLMFALITPPVKLRCVYALDLNNGTVKIGVTNNLSKRIHNIKTAFVTEALAEHHSAFMPEFHAVDIERRIFKTLSRFKVASEVFAVSFEIVCNEIDRYADDIAEYNRNYILRHLSEIQETYAAMGEALREIYPPIPADPIVDEVAEPSPVDDCRCSCHALGAFLLEQRIEIVDVVPQAEMNLLRR